MREIKTGLKSDSCYLLSDRVNRRYLSGIDVAEGYLLYSDNPVYFTDMRYFLAVKEKLAGFYIAAAPFFWLNDIKAEIIRQKIKTVYIDFTRTTLSEYAEYKKLFGKRRKIKDCSAEISALRSIKSDNEIKSVKRACEIAEQAVRETFAHLSGGITEKELKKFLEERMISLGAEDTAFDTIVAFGKNSAVPHHETGDDKLCDNQAVLIDTGCKINGYCSDITRTAFYGEPSEEFLKAYDAVLCANLKAEREIYASMSGKAADKIARDLLIERGYGEYFTHSLGHGVGLEIHESPRLSLKSDDVLTDNMIFTVEPGVYIDGKFGIRIEDTCVMTGAKAVRLFSDDKKLIVTPLKK